jgi:hypothetical protein
MLNHRLQIAEYAFFVGSVVGWVVAIASGQIIYAAVPVSVSLLLNLINRLRFEQRMRRRLTAAMNQLHRQLLEENDAIHEQQLKDAIAQLQAQLPGYLSQIEAADSHSSDLNIIQLKAQLASLEQSLSSVVQYLNSSSLPARVENLEKAIGSRGSASATAELGPIHHPLPDVRKRRMDGIERRLQANQPEDAQAPLTKAVTEPQLFTPPPKESAPEETPTVSSPVSTESVAQDLPIRSLEVPLAAQSRGEQNQTPPRFEGGMAGQDVSPAPVQTQDFSSSPQTWSHLHTLTGHSDWVYSLAISPDGQTLASGSFDKTIKLWQLSTGQRSPTLYLNIQRQCFALLSVRMGKPLASGSFDETIKLWHLDTGELICTLTGHTASVRSLAIATEGQALVSGSFDETIKLWRLDTGEFIGNVAEQTGAVSAIAISPDGQTIASGARDGIITLRQLDPTRATTKPAFTLTLTGNLSSVCSLAISPDGQILAAGCTDGNVKLWQLSSGELLNALNGHLGPVMSAVFSLDAQTLISGSADGTIRIWHLATGEQLGVLTNDSAGSVMSVAISPDGQLIAGGGADSTVKIWQRD